MKSSKIESEELTSALANLDRLKSCPISLSIVIAKAKKLRRKNLCNKHEWKPLQLKPGTEIHFGPISNPTKVTVVSASLSQSSIEAIELEEKKLDSMFDCVASNADQSSS